MIKTWGLSGGDEGGGALLFFKDLVIFSSNIPSCILCIYKLDGGGGVVMQCWIRMF